jgi:hypothetical protein
MPKFLILHNATEKASVFMAHFSVEEQRAAMDAWIAWKTEAEKTVKFEFGMPLDAIAHVLPDGTRVDSESPVSGYSIMEGDKDAVMAALKTHPHLGRAGASLEVLEMIQMQAQPPKQNS